MNNFIFFAIFMVVSLVSSTIASFPLLYKEKYKEVVAGAEVYHSIYKSKQKKKIKKLILGDSVGKQMFPNTDVNDTVYSLACNQAVSMAGHFLLLNNFISAGNKIDSVYIVMRPFSFQNNLNQIYTYQYFVKPFFNEEYKPFFTGFVEKQIHKIPFWYFCQVPIILTTNWSPEFNSKDTVNYTFISPVAAEYLAKIRELGKTHDFKLILVPTPISFTEKEAVEKLDKNEIVTNGFTKEFENYFEKIIYLNDTNFLPDGTHLKDPQKYANLIMMKFM